MSATQEIYNERLRREIGELRARLSSAKGLIERLRDALQRTHVFRLGISEDEWESLDASYHAFLSQKDQPKP